MVGDPEIISEWRVIRTEHVTPAYQEPSIDAAATILRLINASYHAMASRSPTKIPPIEARRYKRRFCSLRPRRTRNRYPTAPDSGVRRSIDRPVSLSAFDLVTAMCHGFGAEAAPSVFTPAQS